MSNQIVPQGYKQTKVGVIPVEWEVVKLEEYIDELEAGVSVNSMDSICQNDKEKGILKTSAISDGKFISSEHKKIIEKDIDRAKLNPKQGNLIISRMNTPELVGAIAIIKKDFNNLYLPDRLWQTKFSKTKKLNSFWLNYLLNTYKYKSKVKILGTGTSGSMKNISKKAFLKLKIPLPPLKEQQKIAEILTTWESAISKQEELVKAKEELKKGLMQKLLSGEVRFEGFDGEWEMKKIGDIFEITRGQVLAVTKMSKVKTEDYKYPVYSSQTKNNGLTGFYNEYLFENCITWTTDGANAGDTNLRIGKFYCTNVCGVLKSDKGYVNQCIAETLNLVTKKYVSYVGNPKLMNNTMSIVKINIPPSIKEQQKIAQVLTTTDKEITLLKEELEVLKEQKRGLMQRLLSGGVRVKV